MQAANGDMAKPLLVLPFSKRSEALHAHIPPAPRRSPTPPPPALFPSTAPTHPSNARPPGECCSLLVPHIFRSVIFPTHHHLADAPRQPNTLPVSVFVPVCADTRTSQPAATPSAASFSSFPSNFGLSNGNQAHPGTHQSASGVSGKSSTAHRPDAPASASPAAASTFPSASAVPLFGSGNRCVLVRMPAYQSAWLRHCLLTFPDGSCSSSLASEQPCSGQGEVCCQTDALAPSHRFYEALLQIGASRVAYYRESKQGVGCTGQVEGRWS